ncbi:MAG: histidine phosphatase family protein [Corynebacteriales bacterium]|nr:histidine phosphatase family protein [Mycobacteriales bacterium]
MSLSSASSTVVHVIRHGEVDNPTGIIYGRMSGFHLSETGQQMAKLAAESLADRDITHVFSSPLERALETAEPFSQQFGLPVEIDERLIEPENNFEGERFSVGDGALRRPKSWWALRNPVTPSWGEPYALVRARMFASLYRARDEAVGHEAVCISHQLAIEVLRRAATGRRLWHNPRNRMCTLASVTSFVFSGDTVVDVQYAEPAIELVPPHLRSKMVKP